MAKKSRTAVLKRQREVKKAEKAAMKREKRVMREELSEPDDGESKIATADDLTRNIQKELLALGYDPGATDGKMTTQTAIAISRFQAEQGLEVTGEPTPELEIGRAHV